MRPNRKTVGTKRLTATKGNMLSKIQSYGGLRQYSFPSGCPGGEAKNAIKGERFGSTVQPLDRERVRFLNHDNPRRRLGKTFTGGDRLSKVAKRKNRETSKKWGRDPRAKLKSGLVTAMKKNVELTLGLGPTK